MSHPITASRSIIALVAALVVLAPCRVQAQSISAPADALRNGFAAPPAAARLRCYWWWLNGNTNEETITHDLTEMKAKGFGGVLLIDANGSDQNGNADTPAGPLFGSPAWTRLYVHALKTAAALHLEVTLNITSGWNLGGPDVKPADASKILTWSRQTVAGGSFDGELPMPAVKNGFYRQIAMLAYPLAHGPQLPGEGGDTRAAIRDLRFKTASAETGFSMPPSAPLLEDVPAVAGEQDTLPGSVVDITSHVDSAGRLRWTPPSAGPWEVLRIGYTDAATLDCKLPCGRVSTSSGDWQGLAIDYLDRGAFDTYWDHTVSPLLEASRPYLKTTLVNLATDSWELGGTNWTGRFAAEFRRRRGYDPMPYLPVIAGRIVGDRATSDRFLNSVCGLADERKVSSASSGAPWAILSPTTTTTSPNAPGLMVSAYSVSRADRTVHRWTRSRPFARPPARRQSTGASPKNIALPMKTVSSPRRLRARRTSMANRSPRKRA
jgi:hypothetical protein